jgi:hypothetical protein
MFKNITSEDKFSRRVKEVLNVILDQDGFDLCGAFLKIIVAKKILCYETLYQVHFIYICTVQSVYHLA